MLKKPILTIAALSLLIPCPLSAQQTEDPDGRYIGLVHVNKTIKDFNYDTMKGTIHLESYIGSDLVSKRKPLDIVPDVSNSKAVIQSKKLAMSGSADNVYFKDDKYTEDNLPKNAEAIAK